MMPFSGEFGVDSWFQDALPPDLEYSSARNSSVVIGGLFLNNGVLNTRRIYRLMKRSVSYFADHSLILLENDSNDGTTWTLQSLCERDEDTLCINLRGFKKSLRRFQNDIDTSPHNAAFGQARFSKMSWYRNMVLNRVTRMMTADYFVFCDPDLFKEAWFPTVLEVAKEYESAKLGPPPKFGGYGHAWKAPSILQSIHRANEQQPDWSAICLYGTLGEKSSMYDMLAFRLSDQTPIPELAQKYRPGWSRDDWNFQLSGTSIERQLANDTELHLAMFVFEYHSKELVPVRSCFGGMTIYKVSKLRESGCVYDERARDCEHVTLNNCLFEKYPNSIFLDTNSRINYDNVAPR